MPVLAAYGLKAGKQVITFSKSYKQGALHLN